MEDLKDPMTNINSYIRKLRQINGQINQNIEKTKSLQKEIFNDNKEIRMEKLRAKFMRKREGGSSEDGQLAGKLQRRPGQGAKPKRKKTFKTRRLINRKLKKFLSQESEAEAGPKGRIRSILKKGRDRGLPRVSGDARRKSAGEGKVRITVESHFRKRKSGRQSLEKTARRNSSLHHSRKSVRKNHRQHVNSDIFNANDYIYKIPENKASQNIKSKMNEYNDTLHPFIVNKDVFSRQMTKGGTPANPRPPHQRGKLLGQRGRPPRVSRAPRPEEGAAQEPLPEVPAEQHPEQQTAGEGRRAPPAEVGRGACAGEEAQARLPGNPQEDSDHPEQPEGLEEEERSVD